MKNILFFTIAFWAICINSIAAGPKIVCVQNIKIKPFEEALIGFKSVCRFPIVQVDASILNQSDVKKEILRLKPDLVITIGTNALLKVRDIKSVPILYMMVLNPQSILPKEKNITGVSINISQEKQLKSIGSVLPEVKKIGLIYDPKRSGYFVKQALPAANKLGMSLILEEVQSSKDVPSLMMEMKGKIDAFWMIPDLSVITPETVDFLLYFSFTNKIPILSFSEKYVKSGALLSICMDPFDIGLQAGEMANKIIIKKGATLIPEVNARKAIISINSKIAKKFNIEIDLKHIKDLRIID